MQIHKEWLSRFLLDALKEDRGEGDITTAASFQTNNAVGGVYIIKEEGIVAGIEPVQYLYELINPDIVFTPEVKDGDRVTAGQDLGYVTGPVRDLMECERLSLNLLQRLSGIATKTDRYVECVSGTGVSILDTRKTTPGMRELEKYAVALGGGVNHRAGLYDQVLVKDNHIAYQKNLGERISVSQIREKIPEGMLIEIEVRNFDEACERIDSDPPDIIMLDNMSPEEMSRVITYAQRHAGIQFEASGGITLETVRAAAETGVDRISIGELTHSVRSLDIGFYL